MPIISITPDALRTFISGTGGRLDKLERRSTAVASGVLPDNVERWVKYTTMFDAPDLVAHPGGYATVQIASIPANSVATGLRFAVPTLFVGTAITDIYVYASTLSAPGGSFLTGSFSSGLSLFSITSVAATDNLAATALIVAGSSPTPIQVPFDFLTGIGSDLTDGQLDTYIRLSIPQSTATTLPSA